MEENLLINKAEKYLKNIKKNISIKNIENFDNFNKLYFELDDNINHLQELKDSMEAQGYTSPYRSLNKYGTGTVGEVSIDELGETSHHNQYFRTKANDKKNILDRVKSAIDAHRIAIGHLEQFGYVKCNSCYKTYRMNDYKNNNKKCSCGNSDFTFKINKDQSYRIEIIPYLPLEGNYMVIMSQMTEWGRDAFKKVLNGLKQERKGVIKTISLIIRYKDKNDRWARKTVNFDSEYVNNYEEEIRKQYGKNVRIEVLRFHRTKPAIIDDKHARIALALAYVKYSEEIIEKIKDSIFKKRISDFKRLNNYLKIHYNINNKKPNFFENDIEIEEWRTIELEKKLKEIGYLNKNNKLNRSLNRDLKIKKNIEKTIFTNIAPTLILWDIFKYYLTTSNNQRKINISPFPYIRVELDRQQRKIFANSYTKAIETIIEETNIKILTINEMDYILHKKFKIEKELKNLNIKINYPALGCALIHSHSKIPIDIIGNIFNVNESKIKKEIKNIETINKPKSNKSKKFLELIKK